MNNQDQAPTIAELWRKFQDVNSPSSWKGFGKRPSKSDKQFVSEYKENELDSIRLRLLDRCRKPLHTFDGTVSLGFHIDGAHLHIHPFAICTPSDLEEIEAMIGFARWELEHRKREKQGKND